MGGKRERVKKIFADKRPSEEKKYSKRRAGVMLSVISAVTCVLTVLGFFAVNKLSEAYENGNVLRDLIAEHPVISGMIMILICAVQVIVAFIPGEVVEVAAGYAFGTFGGAALCTLGISLGSVISILLARRCGRPLVEAFYPREKLESLPVLSDSKKRNAIVTLLFLIPGTPKDLFTSIVGLTDMSIPLYLLLTTVSRFPSIIMSTAGGDAMGEKEWMNAVWLFVITGIISGTGYLIYLFIQKRQKSGKSV